MNSILTVDEEVFYFINSTLSNSVTDYLMPIITSFDYWLPVYIIGIIYLISKYKVKGLYILILLLFVVGICDFINHNFFKEWFSRPRPCKSLEDVNLLIKCGTGYSFPSNHAVNNFSAASVLSFYFQRKRAVLFSVAGLVALSRVFVGVHYMFDIIAGALIGMLIAFLVIKPFTILKFDEQTRELIRIN